MARTQQSTLIGSFNTLNDTKAFISEGRIVAEREALQLGPVLHGSDPADAVIASEAKQSRGYIAPMHAGVCFASLA